MALSLDTLHALADVESASATMPRDRIGKLPIPRELARVLVLMTEEIARLDERVKELEESA